MFVIGTERIEAEDVFDGLPTPTSFIAETRYVYVVSGITFVSEYVVDVVSVFVTRVDHVEPLSVDLSTMYPVIGVPPLLLDAFQLRFICRTCAEAVSPIGADGTVVRPSITET